MKYTTILLVIFAICFSSPPADAQFEDMTKMIPGDANVIVLVNEKELASSQYAKDHDWATGYEKAFEAGVTVIPPSVDDYVLAASVDLEFGNRNWEIALIKDLEGGIDLSQAAKKFKGVVDQIAGEKVALLPGDTHLVQFSKQVAGGISPANRQQTGRWIRKAKSSGNDSISTYLQTAAGYANKYGTDIVIALDLNDAMGENDIKQIAKLSNNSEALTALLKTLKGVTLGINVTDKLEGKILLDFDADASAFRDVGKDLIVQSLGKYGMMIDDIKGWNANTVGNRFELSGELGEQGMRRLFSLSQPTGLSADHYSASSANDGLTKEQKNIRYIQSVFSLQKDFQAHDVDAIQLRNSWLKKSIEKIESLSIVDIDDSLVQFSDSLTDKYRGILDTIAEERAHEKIKSANVQGSGYGYRYRGSRYRGYSASSARNAIKQRNRADGEKQVKGKLQDIEVMVRDFKNSMSKKYGIDF